eukprot:8231453-Heterocapsa_arctica.AAC.1
MAPCLTRMPAVRRRPGGLPERRVRGVAAAAPATKTDQQSINNRSNIDQKSIKNRSKIYQQLN